MDVLHSNCPACRHRFIPWSVWKITRWSCIACPACGAKLNRQLDGWTFALFFVFLLAFGTLLRMVPAHGVQRVLAVAAGVVILYGIDVCTVRLRQATSRTRLGGYKV